MRFRGDVLSTDMSKKSRTLVMTVAAVMTLVGSIMVLVAQFGAWDSPDREVDYSDVLFCFTMCCSVFLMWTMHKNNEPDTHSES